MPHLLIAGQTGSGKSFCVNSIIASLLFQCTPDELNLLMIDPKMVEMAQYEDIPHLRYPVVIDLAEAGKVLLWAVEEMERALPPHGGGRIPPPGRLQQGPHRRRRREAPRPDWVPAGEAIPKPLPYLVIIIDELADLMMFAPDDVEPAICRLTAKARAVGIHLVVATQRPSVDVVTGLIKANMPSRIAFAVSSQIDSRVVLDMAGAESLLGRGDMLYLPYDQGRPRAGPGHLRLRRGHRPPRPLLEAPGQPAVRGEGRDRGPDPQAGGERGGEGGGQGLPAPGAGDGPAPAHQLRLRLLPAAQAGRRLPPRGARPG